jgi:hypothetical protein
VKTNDFILDNSSQRHIVKDLIDFAENRILIRTVLIQPSLTLVEEAESVIDALVFMVASEQMNLFGISEFQSQQQSNSFQRLTPSVYIVAQKQVIERLDVSVFQLVTRSPPQVKKTHQI